MTKKNIRHLIEQRHHTRRQFLIGTGSMFLTLPPLISMMSRTAAAQTVSTKKIRSVVYAASLGIDRHQLFQLADPPGLVQVPGFYSTYTKRLDTFSGPISRMIDSSFTSMFPHMNILKGLSLTGGQYQGHHRGLLGGTHSGLSDPRSPRYGKSIDLVMENSPNVYIPGQAVAYKAIRIQDTFCYERDASGALTVPGSIKGDMALFNTIFGSLPTTQGGAQTQAQIDAKANKKSIVDQVYVDLNNLKNNKKLSLEDKNILDRYIAGVVDLQNKVKANVTQTGPVCTKPVISLESNASGNGFKFPHDPSWGVQNVSVMFDNYLEMIKLAFMCDLTRIVVIGDGVWSDLLSDMAMGNDLGLHHKAPSSDVAADRQKWALLKMLKLAQSLKATTDPFGGGTLLDNSSILYTNELGDWTTSHSTYCMPAVMFGSAGGFFKTGNYMDYTQRPIVAKIGISSSPSAGRPYKQLLQSIMQSMGVPKSEYISFGDGNGYGEFREDINQFGHVIPTAFSAYKNEHNDTLPFIT